MTDTLQHIRIASRNSPLALWQSETIAKQLKTAHPGLHVEIGTFSTRADRHVDRPLTEIGGKGLFVKEIDQALLDGNADIAVHSAKDMPAEVHEALAAPLFCERTEVRDAVIMRNPDLSLADLAAGSCVGTSSLRRQSQLLAMHPHLAIQPLRGNVPTRLDKLRTEGSSLQAIILAATGLERMNRRHDIHHYLDTEAMLPAAGQGALGIVWRKNAPQVQALCTALFDAPTQYCIDAERAVVKALGAHCFTPLAVYAQLTEHGDITLEARLIKLDGSHMYRSCQQGPCDTNLSLAEAAAKDLLAQGAGPLLTAYHPDLSGKTDG